ncbi:MAG: hypothetical protein E7483_05465 [Ruminococcaceae bacterium]|nr:hypothetical protein [Oscillospiraceae bacterium]
MEYTFKQRAEKIVLFCLNSKSTNPIKLFGEITAKDFVRMHGPEHHIIDGACLLTAFYNTGGKIDLKQSLLILVKEAERMPGAICGLWGVCGAATSIGAALAVIDGTGPLSSDGSWGKHMVLCGDILKNIGATKGPRCCKRDGVIALLTAVEYISTNFDIQLDKGNFACSFSGINSQCIADRCPFRKG